VFVVDAQTHRGRDYLLINPSSYNTRVDFMIDSSVVVDNVMLCTLCNALDPAFTSAFTAWAVINLVAYGDYTS
jgi:hypothetical protein